MTRREQQRFNKLFKQLHKCDRRFVRAYGHVLNADSQERKTVQLNWADQFIFWLAKMVHRE
jgi:hypothetical protein